MRWRRVRCLVLLPLAALAMGLSIYVFTKDSPIQWSQFGKLVQLASLLSVVGLLLASAFGVVYFQKFRESALAMLAGWGLAFVVPALLAFLPLTWQVALGPARAADRAAALSELSVLGGLFVLAQLTPTLFALPLGALRGSSCVRTLLPESGLPGWIMLAAAGALLVLFAISLVFSNQIAPNPLPTVGLGLLLAAPVFLLADWRSILRPVPAASGLPFEASVRLFQQLFFAGVGALVLFFFSYEVNGVRLMGVDEAGSVIRPWDAKLWKLVTEFLARSLATMILFADLSLQVAIRAWRLEQEFHQTGGVAERDRVFAELDASL